MFFIHQLQQNSSSPAVRMEMVNQEILTQRGMDKGQACDYDSINIIEKALFNLPSAFEQMPASGKATCDDNRLIKVSRQFWKRAKTFGDIFVF